MLIYLAIDTDQVAFLAQHGMAATRTGERRHETSCNTSAYSGGRVAKMSPGHALQGRKTWCTQVSGSSPAGHSLVPAFRCRRTPGDRDRDWHQERRSLKYPHSAGVTPQGRLKREAGAVLGLERKAPRRPNRHLGGITPTDMKTNLRRRKDHSTWSWFNAEGSAAVERKRQDEAAAVSPHPINTTAGVKARTRTSCKITPKQPKCSKPCPETQAV